MLCVFSVMKAQANSNGLHFNSHSFTPNNRTSLLLNNHAPISIDNGFKMSFKLDLRRGEPLFGNICCIKTGDGRHIDVTLSMPSENAYKPALVVDGKLHYINYLIKPRDNINVEVSIDLANGTVTLSFDGHKTTVAAKFGSSSAKILFGMHIDDDNYVDVAPMNVRDIRISYNGKAKYFWSLLQHDDSISLDNISQAPATAIRGQWMVDDHVMWKTLLKYKSKGKVQVTYNPKDNIFYIVDNKAVRCFDPVTKTTKTVSVRGGHRAMMYSNYIAYSTLGPGLYTYNVKDRIISSFDFASGRWSNDKYISEEPGGYNHSWAMASDTVAYMFGGYGFFKYKNALWRINPKSGEMRELDYSPKIAPRTGAAAAVVGDKLYIFGGYGNESGEQELPCFYYYDLTRIDLKTLKAETLWNYEGDQQGVSFQLASEMIYNSKDSSFYVACTYKSGRLLKVKINEPGFTVVSDRMNTPFDYKDMTFNLYENKETGKLYVVIDRRMNNLEHNISICSLDLPVQDNYIADMEAEQKAGASNWWWLLLLIIPAGAATDYLIRRNRNKAGKFASDKATAQAKPDTEGQSQQEESTTPTPAGQQKAAEEPEKAEAPVKYYQPESGYISILGKFVVHDSNGEDITPLFTRRTRNLLFILLLYSERDEKGIEIRQLDEALWQEMNEESARNNRNVYIRKLRMLLTKIGDIEIINDKIHYRIRFGKDVFFDYHEALAMMARMEEDDSEETTARTLELLFEGPLLPNYSFEWLDKFKADYSDAVISLLTRQLRQELQKGNDDLALKIAETIMMHDPFSDNALATQCSILCRRHKTGIAKTVYDNFCKNYETCLGEKYHLSFTEVCNK